MITRRFFIKTSLISAGALSQNPNIFANNGLLPVSQSTPTIEVQGHLLGLSTFQPSTQSSTISRQEKFVRRQLGTVLTDLDISKRTTTHHDLGIYKFGHSLIQLPNGMFFSIPYGDDDMPCLFLDTNFNIIKQVKAPPHHGFGGHGALLPDGKSLFVHFNKSTSTGDGNTGKLGIINIKTMVITHTANTNIVHGHDIICSLDRNYIVVADDGHIESPAEMHKDKSTQPDSPYVINSKKPALHLFSTATYRPVKVIPLAINGSLVHIEQGADHKVYGAVEQYVHRNKLGFSAIQLLLGEQANKYIAQFDPMIFAEELPYPGPLLSVDLQSGDTSEYFDQYNQDPFDIKRNEFTSNLLSVFTSSQRLAKRDFKTGQWHYFSTLDFNIEEPFGLCDIAGTKLMAINGFQRGITIFNCDTMTLIEHYDVPTNGIKHLLHYTL